MKCAFAGRISNVAFALVCHASQTSNSQSAKMKTELVPLEVCPFRKTALEAAPKPFSTLFWS